jgi:hypothetical protein
MNNRPEKSRLWPVALLLFALGLAVIWLLNWRTLPSSALAETLKVSFILGVIFVPLLGVMYFLSNRTVSERDSFRLYGVLDTASRYVLVFSFMGVFAGIALPAMSSNWAPSSGLLFYCLPAALFTSILRALLGAYIEPHIRAEEMESHSDEEMDKHEKQILRILGEDHERTMRNAERYRKCLLEHLSLPVRATGAEDFSWEEPYIFGGWSKKEYNKLKKIYPSYTDTFEIESLAPPNDFEDVLAKVRRLSDGKRFEIGLSWLTCTDEDSNAYTLLKDYGAWHTNY